MGIEYTLKGHTGIVIVVRWVPGRTRGEEIIVSGSVDHSVRIWKETNGRVDSVLMRFNCSFRNFKFCRNIRGQSIVSLYYLNSSQRALQTAH